MRSRRFCRGPDLLGTGVSAAIGDVLDNRGVEQHHVLVYQANLRAQRIQLETRPSDNRISAAILSMT
ncbi:hypothetical protein [Thermomonas sp.]